MEIEQAMARLRHLQDCALHWTADPRRHSWLRAHHEGEWLNIRLNPQFPSGPMYALQIGSDDFVTLEDFPPTWTRGPLVWPDSAAPLAYDERFDYDDLG
ncbi:hypothetical protein JMUB6875_40640 [Nocardia sp. JMUB6875]|uniref:hypothetical protein n=1 Tax=Nocardia sp. JMUB6875 TaxID=3158170 RepID=UPI0032E67569